MTEAAQLIDTLGDVLGDVAQRIEHIGSTAIPSMTSKDVIDLQVSVVELTSVESHFDLALDGMGFERSPYRMDHVPCGRPDVEAQWEKRLWTRRIPRAIDVNLQVRRAGSENERLALLFRDWFLAHESAVLAYGKFKQSLSAITEDTGVYTDVKDSVVDVVIVAAEEWAEQSGWSV